MVLQKLLKYFNGTVVLTSFLPLFPIPQLFPILVIILFLLFEFAASPVFRTVIVPLTSINASL